MRFNIDTLILPVFFCIVQLNQSDLNLSIYSITLEYDDKDSTTTVGPYYIEQEPKDLTQPIPTAPSRTSDGYQMKVSYYFSYSFSYFISLINKSLSNAYNDLKAAVPTSPELKNGQASFLG